MAAPKTTNAAPTFTTAAQSTSFTEIADTTGSTALASYSTTVSFADANTADTHKVAIANVTARGTTTGLPGKTTLLSWLKSGTLTQAAGSGSFTLSFSAADRSFDYLAAGQTLTLTYTVQLSDNKGAVTSQNFTVTITGTNDLPVIGNPSMAMVTEDKSATKAGLLVASGTLSISDADTGQSSFSTVVLPAEGTLGTLTISSTGAYTYSVSNALTQFLGAGDTKVETFTVRTADGTTKDISFTINGANDAAVIGTPTVTTVTDHVDPIDGYLIASGTLSVTDVDAGEAVFQSTVTSANGNLGTLTIAGDGQ